MARAGTSRKVEKRREQILAVALDEFSEHGFNDASLNRIIESEGLSKGSMYYYFKDKEDLFCEVVTRAFAPFASIPNKLDRVTDSDSFWSEIERLAQAVYVLAQADPRMAGLTRSIYELGSAKSMPRMKEIEQRWTTWVARVSEIGRSVGAVRDDVPHELLVIAANSLFSGIDRWVSEHWALFPEATIHDEIEAGLRLLRSMAEPPAQKS